MEPVGERERERHGDGQPEPRHGPPSHERPDRDGADDSPAPVRGRDVTAVTEPSGAARNVPRMYGRVLGVTVLGVGGHLVTVEAFVGTGVALVHVHGAPRRRRPGRAGADPSGRGACRPGVAAPPGRGEPRPGEPAQGGAGARPPDRGGAARRDGAAAGPRGPGWAFAGELSLKGELLPTPGVLSVAIAAARAGLAGVVVPEANALEAAQVGGLRVAGVPTLREVVGLLEGTWSPPAIEPGAVTGRPGRRRRPRPRSAASSRPGARSRWRPRAATTC